MATALATQAKQATPSIIRFGRKEVYLPKFVISLLHTPDLSPYHAQFQVPLFFSKLDLKDYLYHAYKLKTTNIRSAIYQPRISQDKPGARIPAPRRWHRPRAIKYMTVEMEKPFVWPEVPEDFSAWDKEVHDQIEGQEEDEKTLKGGKGLREKLEKKGWKREKFLERKGLGVKEEKKNVKKPDVNDMQDMDVDQRKEYVKMLDEQARRLRGGEAWKPSWKQIKREVGEKEIKI